MNNSSEALSELSSLAKVLMVLTILTAFCQLSVGRVEIVNFH